ncbi:DUF1671-domain-containing protein [Viridothelium virens]|uniref:DUF1671-domain-containing protein n=1 Tax=Viridothelium virens TaxID=1048519 RepID=A0A6A6H5L4_VIRVR|nr:DUF1671-domain-containing protein [Viridothelium virens]
MWRRSLESSGHEVSGVINALAELCDRDDSVESGFLCHPSTIHIAKKPGQGQLCGYRNIQMLISYLLIECAWDKGINADGRIDTGGIKGTRKYIGTPEAQALFRSIEIPCRANLHRETDDGLAAYESLLASVEQYFRSATKTSTTLSTLSKVEQTELPPVFLQRLGHSLTIVGFERRTDGTSNLLVFDPMFDIRYFMKHYLKSGIESRRLRFVGPKLMLDPFRQGSRVLRRFKAFETISLTTIAC